MSNLKRSPFAPSHFPDMPAIAGFKMATAEAGVRYKGRTDLWVLVGSPGTQTAGVYTQNKCPGAPIDWSRKALGHETDGPAIVVVNSGTANVFGGQKSRDAVVETARGAARAFGGATDAIQLASTGVIGEALDASKVVAQFDVMARNLSPQGWEEAAKAIMTTDTHPKGATLSTYIDGVKVMINGIAKGSGMISPDMATMLAYVVTDANISKTALQSMQIVKDGEGISKFITIKVTGAVSDSSAKKVGQSIANSPPVKTAIAGEDANWGRIVMAVGKAGEPAERDSLSIWIGPHLLAEKGERSEAYTEADLI